MKTIKSILAVAIIMLFVFGQSLSAQFNIRPTISSMADDNVNNNAFQIKSNVTTFNLNSGYSWDNESNFTSLYYDGTFTYFESFLQRTNHFHSINTEYTQLYGSENQNALNVGGLLGTSINRDDYVIFNHSQLSGFINYKYFAADWLINKFGYSFRSVGFVSLNDFSFTEHSIFAHAAFAATSTTTAIVQADLGTKFYSTTPSGSSSSMRKGVMSSLLPSVTQLTGMIKLGQRITDELGVSITERYQWNIQKQTRYLSSDYGFISDDELFDDHYGYEGFHTNATITSLLSETIMLKLSGGLQNKLYSSLSAYDWDGNVVADQRIDARTYFNIGLRKNFEDLGFSLKGAVDVIQNSSNDSFYSYKNNAFTLEISVPFSN
ncbi:MAG: hypothetical protein Q8L88_08135 [Bacteroidota bacterium]|nr:hypothetical protein [Bacteroidota bacterium]